MAIDTARVREQLRRGDFTNLFLNELGWDRYPGRPLTVTVGAGRWTLRGIAQKRDLAVLAVAPGPDGQAPDSATRRRIEREVAKVAHEHLLIFTDAAGTEQTWQWARREPGGPTAYREQRFVAGQAGFALIEKLRALTFSLDEEAELDITAVTARVRGAFDVEQVTKRFYDRFKIEHAAFLGFVDGIASQGDRQWYASLMLNRLMFVYFIQKKGFLDGDRDYLRNRLRLVQKQRGPGEFLSFYRYFLRRLFHEGLDLQAEARKADLAPLLGKVPYLNGGLFALHQVEQANPDIDIPDEAFTQVFAFFDEWDWTLDTRTTRSGKEINPDILGHIFEKYINQKDTGAYYTKEDITEYIAKNTILPFLLARAAGDVAIAFEPGGATWRLLSENPDRYIHDALLRGVDIPLPPGIAVGEHDTSKRSGWDRPADPAYASPGETWREHLARRWRCRDLRARLRDGQIHTVDDLVTLNLNIRQFAQDVIAYSEGPEIVSSLYRAIEQLTVLDPTCGSGAFLFAALNVLKPVYDACLDRMQGFIDETDALGEASNGQGQRRFEYFRAILARMSGHPSRDYFVLKSIILDNLYGVDLMGEAVEICKLRLFLKLASHVEPVAAKPNYGLEPLPDIDFNIRAGNTLVGFTTDEEVQQALTSRFDLPGEVARIAKHAATVEGSFKAFREMQTRPDLEAGAQGEKKRKLSEELATLGDALDRYLAAEHGINPASGEALAQWRASHRPFHWLSEFHGIMKGGGFDVIIGNPPWKEYAAVRGSYTVRGYETEKCGNLHAMCTERAVRLRSPHGWASFIVQLPLVSSSRMVSARNLLRRSSDALFVATFDDRPGKLFDGLQHCRSVIFLSRNGPSSKRGFLATTRYQRWPTASRDDLFAKLEYAKALADPILPGLFPKYANALEEALFAKVKTRGRQTVGFALSKRPTKYFIFYQEATQYWIKATVGLPYYAKNGVVGAPAHGRYLYFATVEEAHAACALLNSNLFYAYFIAYGDCFHLSDMLVSNFPVPPGLLGDPVLQQADARLMADLARNAETRTIRTSDGNAISYAEFYGARSKPIIDEIDRLLAKHYGFTDEELDFVVNYDIKYRMGREAGEEGEG